MRKLTKEINYDENINRSIDQPFDEFKCIGK
jgi:hypothetical protein